MGNGLEGMPISGVSLAYILHIIISLVLTIQILLDNKLPQSSIAWILALYLFPYIGPAFYLLSGVNWKRRKIVRQRPEELFGTHLKPALDHQQIYIAREYERLDNDVVKTLHMNLFSSNALITMNNKVEVFHQGEPMFESMFSDLKQAKTSIHLEYFIFRDDELGEELSEILMQRCAEGVEVKLLVDGFGSMFTLSPGGRRRLLEAGVQVRTFLNPKNIIGAWMINYSNHRKIAVIDGKIAYTGGMNIGKEYLDGGMRFANWRDTHMKISGELTALLQSVFLADWINSGGKVTQPDQYFSLIDEQDESDSPDTLPAQILCSGPDSTWYAIQHLYFNMIANADKKVLIQSPYFVPDDGIKTAMETAALSGIDVRLMMTGLPDKRIPFWAAHTYFHSLLEAGVKIYLYKDGFLHTKMVAVDDVIVTTGSCNMDVRSFFLDYELNLVFYDDRMGKEFSDKFEEDMNHCIQLTREDVRKTGFARNLRNSVCRVFSPLL